MGGGGAHRLAHLLPLPGLRGAALQDGRARSQGALRRSPAASRALSTLWNWPCHIMDFAEAARPERHTVGSTDNKSWAMTACRQGCGESTAPEKAVGSHTSIPLWEVLTQKPNSRQSCCGRQNTHLVHGGHLPLS